MSKSQTAASPTPRKTSRSTVAAAPRDEKPPKKSSRILSLDLMRGWFLIIIILDHLSYFPNGYAWMTGDSRLFVSAAEGFFLVSGIVLGIVRGRKLIGASMKVVTQKLWSRALALYVTSFVITMISILIGWYFFGNDGVKSPIPPRESNLLEVAWQVATFQTIYGWADYLRLYAMFLFVAPGFLWLLRRRLWVVALGISAAVWLIPARPVTEFTQPLTWQLLFFIAMTIGYYLEPIRDWWDAQHKRRRRAIKYTIAVCFGVTLFLNVVSEFVTPPLDHAAARALTDLHATVLPEFYKLNMSLWRIGLSLVWFAGFFLFFRRFEGAIMRRMGWLLLPFGVNSLYVYSIHAFVIMAFHLVRNPRYGDPALYLTSWERYPEIPLYFAISTLALALIYLAVRTKFLMKIIPR